MPDSLPRLQPHAVLQHDPDHAQRRPAQRIRVLAPRRLLVDGPEADQRVELVGQRHGDRDRVARHAVGGALRLVVLLDRRRDRRRPRPAPPRSSGPSAPAARGTRRPSRRRGRPWRAAPPARPCPGRRRPAAPARAPAPRCARPARPACRASRGRRCCRASAAGPPARTLRSRLPEELGVRQPGPHHALVAGDDRGAAVRSPRCSTTSRKRLASSPSPRRAARSISGWPGWWRGSPRAGSSRNASSNAPISTTGHSTSPATSSQQRLVLDQLEALREGEVARVVADDVAAPLRIEHHLGLLERGDVIVEAPHPERRRAP